MTTPPVTSVTDELIAELDEACREHRLGFMIEASEVRALLAEREELKRDAARYRWISRRVGVLNDGYFTLWLPSSIAKIDDQDRAETDAAIDAAMKS